MRRDRHLALRLRELLDARAGRGVTLREAAELLSTHPAHLVRVFGREFGMPPHQCLTTRRVDLARGLLLDGWRPSDVAAVTGLL